jgi:hypothetical protein
MPVGHVLIAKRERSVVVSADQKIRPAIVIEVQNDERLGVAWHDKTGSGRR